MEAARHKRLGEVAFAEIKDLKNNMKDLENDMKNYVLRSKYQALQRKIQKNKQESTEQSKKIKTYVKNAFSPALCLFLYCAWHILHDIQASHFGGLVAICASFMVMPLYGFVLRVCVAAANKKVSDDELTSFTSNGPESISVTHSHPSTDS